MNNQKGFANIILIVLVVILAGAVGYFVFVKKTEPVTQQTTPPATTQTPQQPSPIPINETANWKIYSNNSERYSIKYPPNWHLDSSSPGFVTVTNYDSSVGGRGGSPSVENIRIVISTYTNLSKNETVESWVSKIPLSDRQNILVDSMKAIRGKANIGFNENDQSFGGDVRVVYNGKGYQIAYSPYDSKLTNVFDIILSTFKFLR